MPGGAADVQQVSGSSAVIVGLVLLISAIVIVGSLAPTLPYVNSIR